MGAKSFSESIHSQSHIGWLCKDVNYEIKYISVILESGQMKKKEGPHQILDVCSHLEARQRRKGQWRRWLRRQ